METDDSGEVKGVNKKTPLIERVERIGPYILQQPGAGLRITQDPLLLADFTLPVAKADRLLDIGTGTGVIPLAIVARSDASDITAIEIDAEAARLAQANVTQNKLDDRIKIICADYRDLDNLFPQGHFSTIVSNPPYIKENSGKVSPHKSRASARAEIFGNLDSLLKVSTFLLCAGGRLLIIFPILRFDELMDSFRPLGLFPRRLRFIHPTPDSSAKLFMVEAVKGEGTTGGVKTEESLYLSRT